MAHTTGAPKARDQERVTADTTVQPKAVTHPTDAKLMHKAIVMLGKLARKHGIKPRQSYARVAKQALIMAGRYAHAKQRRRGWKLYSLHAPEVECIAKGKAHKPYEFGCKVSITTTNARSPGGQFVLHARAFHGRPYEATPWAASSPKPRP